MSDEERPQNGTSGEKPEGTTSSPAESEQAATTPIEQATPLEQAEAKVRELEAKLLVAEGEAKNHHARMLRVAADFENHRKRASREVDEAKRSGQQAALQRLLPVFDNLERAAGAVDVASDAKSLADGLRMVMKQFTEALGKLGIERLESLGKPFDPMFHESIQYEHHATLAAGLVAQELQAGYRQGDSLMRPALVVVSKGPAPADAPSSEPAEAKESEEPSN